MTNEKTHLKAKLKSGHYEQEDVFANVMVQNAVANPLAAGLQELEKLELQVKNDALLLNKEKGDSQIDAK